MACWSGLEFHFSGPLGLESVTLYIRTQVADNLDFKKLGAV